MTTSKSHFGNSDDAGRGGDCGAGSGFVSGFVSGSTGSDFLRRLDLKGVDFSVELGRDFDTLDLDLSERSVLDGVFTGSYAISSSSISCEPLAGCELPNPIAWLMGPAEEGRGPSGAAELSVLIDSIIGA